MTNLPSTINLEILNSNTLFLPVTIFLDRVDYVVKLNLHSYDSGDRQNLVKPQFNMDISLTKTLFNLHQSGVDYVYGVFLYNKDLPKANIYTGKIYVYDKANQTNPVSQCLVNITVKEDQWNLPTTVATTEGYMTRGQLLEAVYMVNHNVLLPIDTKDCEKGVLTYRLLEGKKKYVVVANRETGSYLPAGAYYKVFEASTNQAVKLATYQDKVPLNDSLEFMDLDNQGKLKGVANSEVVAGGANKSVAIIYGLKLGKYYLKTYVANEEYTNPVNFTF